MEPKDISPEFQYTPRGFSISEVLLKNIMAGLNSPAYIYSKDIAKSQYNKLRAALPDRVEIFYAVKANPSLAMMQIMKNCGSGFEVASSGELSACRAIGASPDRIVFAGPGKTYVDLAVAVRMGIASINAESYGEQSELERISDVATKLEKRVNVSLRINPNYKIKGATLSMGGESTQFGIEEGKLEEAVIDACSLPGVDFKGIHVYAATNITNHEGFIKNLENTFALSERVNKISPVTLIDIGSGLNISYKDGDKELPLDGLGSKIEEMIDQHSFIRENNARIMIEPGRYLVGASGIYVSRVTEVKESKGKTYALLEGGINHMLRPALIDGSEHRAFNLSRNTGNRIKMDVVGPLCSPLDVLARDIELDKNTLAGDYVGVFCAGAYGFTESMPNFLSHDTAAEVLVHNGRFDITRPSVKAEELLKNQRIPEGI